MKLNSKSTFLLTLALGLTACGGGGGGNSNSGSGGGQTGDGSISDTTGAVYAQSLKAFAETTIAGFFLLPAVADVVNAAAYTGSGNGGGVIAALGFGGPGGITTFTNAKFIGGVASVSPALSGVVSNIYTLTGQLTTANTFFTNTFVKNVVLSGVTAFTVAQPNIPTYSITGLSNVVGTQTPGLPNNLVTIDSGSASFSVGSSSYTTSNLNIKTGATAATFFYTANADTSKQQLYQIAKDANVYTVSLLTTQVVTPGQDAFPSTGALKIAASTLSCTPLTLTFLSAQQFSLSCGGSSITKKWTDADVTSALGNAVK